MGHLFLREGTDERTLRFVILSLLEGAELGVATWVSLVFLEAIQLSTAGLLSISADLPSRTFGTGAGAHVAENVASKRAEIQNLGVVVRIFPVPSTEADDVGTIGEISKTVNREGSKLVHSLRSVGCLV